MEGFIGNFESEGFAIAPDLLTESHCTSLGADVGALNLRGAGTRDLLGFKWAVALARQLRDLPSLKRLLGNNHTAIQATYFFKNPSRNWLVAPHQDLSIPVAERNADAPCIAWSEKSGTWFCQPPVDFLGQLIAVRVHLDDNTAANGPLRIVPGSHRLGRIASRDIPGLRRSLGEVACITSRRTLLAMRPLVLHSSSKCSSTEPRRVIHIVFGPAKLPWGLRWQYAF